MANTSENLTTAQNSGRDYDVDENYIYIVLASPVSTAINIDGAFTANDHGIEYFTNTTVPLTSSTLYGENLKNKLERDVVTISQQSLTSSEQAQVRTNIGSPSSSDFNAVSTKVSNIGTVFTGTNETSLSVANNTITTISTISSLAAGTYVVFGGFQFGSSFTGSNNCNGSIATGTTSQTVYTGTLTRFDGQNGGGYNACAIITFTSSNSNITLRAYQSSGGSVNASNVMLRAIRIV